MYEQRVRYCAGLGVGLLVMLAGAQVTEAENEAGPPGGVVAHEGPPIDRTPPDFAPGVRKAMRGVLVQQGLFESVQVNTTPEGLNIPGDAANEPSIAPSELDGGNLVIGWRQFDTILSDFRQAGQAYSTDGGRTWSGTRVIDPGVFRSDPVVRGGPDGEFYFSSLRTSPGLESDIFRSEDGGRTWEGPFFSYGGDKQWISVDTTEGSGRGNLYQHWASPSSSQPNSFSRSFDRGQAWESPSDFVVARWGQEAVGVDGSVLIVSGDRPEMVVTRVTDAADPGTVPAWGNRAQTLVRCGAFSQVPAIQYLGLIGQGNVSVDHSGGPTHGSIYVLGSGSYLETFNEYDYDVSFARSTDNNLTYSDPIVVHSVTAGHQWFGTMSVASNGRIDVVWNDTRDDPVDPMFPTWSQLYYACSIDAGESWLPEVPVSPPFQHWTGMKLGDYYDAHSDEVGMDVAYAATFNGEQDVYYLRIGTADCNGNRIPDEYEIAAGLVEDLNGDARPDACGCRADFNTDGRIDFFDVQGFLNAFADGSLLADVQPDRRLDVFDLVAFLDWYSSGCP